jgi:hypothetical protein
MGAAARVRFEERFTADRMAGQYLAVYQELLTRSAYAGIEATRAA